VHQIVWVTWRRAVDSSFRIATDFSFVFGEDLVLTGEVNEMNACDQSQVDIPRWCREAGHRLVPCPL